MLSTCWEKRENWSHTMTSSKTTCWSTHTATTPFSKNQRNCKSPLSLPRKAARKDRPQKSPRKTRSQASLKHPQPTPKSLTQIQRCSPSQWLQSRAIIHTQCLTISATSTTTTTTISIKSTTCWKRKSNQGCYGLTKSIKNSKKVCRSMDLKSWRKYLTMLSQDLSAKSDLIFRNSPSSSKRKDSKYKTFSAMKKWWLKKWWLKKRRCRLYRKSSAMKKWLLNKRRCRLKKKRCRLKKRRCRLKKITLGFTLVKG